MRRFYQDVAKFIGHSNTRTTERYYLQEDLDTVRQRLRLPDSWRGEEELPPPAPSAPPHENRAVNMLVAPPVTAATVPGERPATSIQRKLKRHQELRTLEQLAETARYGVPVKPGMSMKELTRAKWAVIDEKERNANKAAGERLAKRLRTTPPA